MEVVATTAELKEVRRQLAELFAELREVKQRRDKIAAARKRKEDHVNERVQARLKQIAEEYDPQLQVLDERIDRLVKSIIQLAAPHFSLLAVKGMKTIKLVSGTLSHRLNPASLRLTDPQAVMKFLRNHGLVSEFSEPQPRKLNTAKLKKALQNNDRRLRGLTGAELRQEGKYFVRPGRSGPEMTIPVAAGSEPDHQQDYHPPRFLPLNSQRSTRSRGISFNCLGGPECLGARRDR